MATNTAQVSPPVRLDPRQVINSLKKTVNWNDAGFSSGIAFDNSLPLAAFITQCLVEIVTTFDGTSPQLTVGTNSTSFNNIVGSGDVNEAATGVTSVTTGLGRSICASADKVVYAKMAVTGSPSQGVAVVVICYEGGWSS